MLHSVFSGRVGRKSSVLPTVCGETASNESALADVSGVKATPACVSDKHHWSTKKGTVKAGEKKFNCLLKKRCTYSFQ